MESIAKYVFEAGMLKRVKRSGWWAEKVEDPESVADHSFRTALIGFILARMEGFDDAAANRVCTAAVFHDMHECRLGDMHKITARYVHITKELERRVEREQAKSMPPGIRRAIYESIELSDKEHTVMMDADYLECAFQAKEYADIGYAGCGTWLKNIAKRLKTKSAKKLHSKMSSMDSGSWREKLRMQD